MLSFWGAFFIAHCVSFRSFSAGEKRRRCGRCRSIAEAGAGAAAGGGGVTPRRRRRRRPPLPARLWLAPKPTRWQLTTFWRRGYHGSAWRRSCQRSLGRWPLGGSGGGGWLCRGWAAAGAAAAGEGTEGRRLGRKEAARVKWNRGEGGEPPTRHRWWVLLHIEAMQAPAWTLQKF